MPIHVPGQKDSMVEATHGWDLVRHLGASITRVEKSLAAASGELRDDGMGGRYLIGPSFHRVHTPPEHHAGIHAWLLSLGGDALIDWLSILAELEHAAPGFWLSGAKGVGKSLLARACAQYFGGAHAVPVSLMKAAARFNDALGSNPVVFGDEAVPVNAHGHTEWDLVKPIPTDTSRQVEQKGMDPAPLHGASRLIVAVNNLNSIKSSADLSPDDIAAIGDRFIYRRISEAQAGEIRSHFAGIDIQSEWLDSLALARHIAWIIENHPKPTAGRLRMAPQADELMMALDTTSGAAAGLVCRALCDWLICHAAGRGEALRGLVWDPENQVVAAMTNAVEGLVGDRGSVWSTSKVGAALKRLAGEQRAKYGDARSYHWQVPLAKLTAWADGDGSVIPEDLAEAIQKLS